MKRMGKPIRALSRSPDRGFTLVELIVVIAILAILAGVAIPVYSNYIKKANEASDLQLISAVNTAFAASCLENGTDARNVAGAELVFTTTDGKTYITGVKNVSGSGLDNDKVNASFLKYFGDNKNTALRYYTEDQIHFNASPDPLAGTFSAGGSGGNGTNGILDSNHVWTGDLAGATAAYNASNWKNMGVDGLTGTVDHLTNALRVYGNMRNVVGDAEGFKEMLQTRFGIDFDSADNATLANATVFYVAERLADANATDLQTALKKDRMATMASGNPVTTNLDNYLSSIGIYDSTEQNKHREYQLVTATLKYALAVAYVYSDGGNIEINSNTGETLRDRVTMTQLSDYNSVINLYNEVQAQAGYSAYLSATTEGAKADLNAFSMILDVLDGNTDAFVDITGSNLFSSDEVQAAINQILSSSGGGG